ncbi:hypothetical protein N018_10980 [Pseudomonas syringae CC1557]|uniref:Uncharacterized protein n=1 Tax=Pseudomonas syringae CC1557 TaxID=1357279 RepID=W0N2P6_PSESX|nr:hypothetical protein N018_10980 [Pseudomonas syringae CC1557]
MVAQIRRPEADLKPEMLLFNDNQTNHAGYGTIFWPISCAFEKQRRVLVQWIRG